MDTLLQKQLEEKCFAFYTHLLEFHWWLFLVVTLAIWWQMDFDGFILEYAADGAEWEGEIWIPIWVSKNLNLLPYKFKIGTYIVLYMCV